MFSVWLIDGFNAFSKIFIKSYVKNVMLGEASGEVEFQLCRVNQSAFTAFCVDFLRCTDIFYYIILYVVREVVTGKMRNLQKSIEKVTICAEKSFEKVAILTKTRLKKCEICQKSLEKIEWVQKSVEKSPALFCLCFIVFCFYENNRLIKKLFLPCAG